VDANPQHPPPADPGGSPAFRNIIREAAGLFRREGGPTDGTSRRSAALMVPLIAIVLIILQDSYVCEDAFITFRTVDNWLSGFGLRWNAVERCQSFTSPLWMLLVTAVYGVTGEIFHSVLFFSVLVSAAALLVFVLRIAADGWGPFVGLAIFLLSRAFIDFSTSGLENPLVHLLVILFFASWQALEATSWTPRRLFLLSLTCGLAVLTRMDTALLFLPALLVVARGAYRHRDRWRMFGVLALGFAPFVLWEVFSVVYYGFPFPNTYYAKTTHGVPGVEIVAQGFLYLRNALIWDPLTLFTIVAGVVFGLASVFRNRRGAALAAGIVLYLGYVVSVGGDHMAGRFLSAPLVCAVLILSTAGLGRGTCADMLLVAVALGLNARCPTLAADFEASHCALDQAKIIDERGCSRPEASLLARSVEFPFDMHTRAVAGREARAKGPHVVVDGWVGIFGFYAGPEVHIVDVLGLGDPLLSRLPMMPVEWRIAHFARPVPEGYQEAVEGRGDIADPSLARYWDRLAVVTRGDIWSLERFREIWRFNTGAYDHLVEEYCRKQFGVESCDQLADKRRRDRARRKRARQLEAIDRKK